MNHCPNPQCPPAIRFGRPTEYRDGVLACADCGAELVAGSAPVAPRAEAAANSDAVPRLVFSLVALLVGSLAPSLTLFGTRVSLFTRLGPSAARPESAQMLQYGLTPFLFGFLVVEVVALIVPSLRARRLGTLKQRAPLTQAALLVGLAWLIVGCSATVQLLDAADAPLAFAQLFVAHVLLLSLALAVNRRGLGNGFLVVGAGFNLALLVKSLERLWGAVLSETVSLGELLTMLALLVLAVSFVVRQSVDSRRRSTRMVAPFPISPINTWAFGAPLPSLMAVLGLASVAQWVRSSSVISNSVTLFLTFDLTLVLGWVFFRPVHVARVWKRWHPERDETDLLLQARALFPRAMMLSLLAAVGFPLVFAFVPAVVGAPLSVPFIFTAMLALVGVDLVEEFRARNRLGALVAVRPVHRMAEVEPVLAVLDQAGIPAHAQSAAWRAAQQFFGPEAPVNILVPAQRAEEARRLLDVE